MLLCAAAIPIGFLTGLWGDKRKRSDVAAAAVAAVAVQQAISRHAPAPPCRCPTPPWSPLVLLPTPPRPPPGRKELLVLNDRWRQRRESEQGEERRSQTKKAEGRKGPGRPRKNPPSPPRSDQDQVNTGKRKRERGGVSVKSSNKRWKSSPAAPRPPLLQKRT